MYHYKELGFVNLEKMLIDAYDGQYAVGAFNFVSIEQFNGIVDALIDKRSPVIFLVSPNLCNQYEYELIARISQSGVDRIKNCSLTPQIALHLDHGNTYEQCVKAIDFGFSSVMIDGSPLPFDENIRLTKKVVDYAHRFGVSVEGELGTLSTKEESSEKNNISVAKYTDPDQVEEFVHSTGVDCLAISIGTNHGLVKMKSNPDGTLPELRFDILNEISNKLPGFPIVLHGASNIPAEYVNMINRYGGIIENTVGISDDQIRKAVKRAVCKINIASDGWIAGLALTRKILFDNPQAIDSRVFKNKIRNKMKELYIHKIELFGSEERL